MIQINQIKLRVPVKNETDQLHDEIRHILHIKADEIKYIKIHKKSLDARKKPDLFYSYSVAVKLCSSQLEEKLLKSSKNANISRFAPPQYEFVMPKNVLSNPSLQRPVIVGTGPAGLFAAYFLSLAGYAPILIERGMDVDARQETVDEFFQSGVLNHSCNVCFGEGGAGTFSDGKLQTQVKDKSGRIRKILEIFVEHGADSSILYDNKPHIGTDILTSVVKNMRNHMIILGAEVRFQTTFTGFIQKNGELCAVEVTRADGSKEVIETSVCVLAIGHSARDTFLRLHQLGLKMENKPFAVGLRIQHDQNVINESQYGIGWEDKKLPAADYKLTYQTRSNRGVYSFCMCPGGYVINASGDGEGVVVNGMSYHDRASGIANSAIVITVDDSLYGKNLFDGMHFQIELERKAYQTGNGKIVLECYGDFKKRKMSEFRTNGVTPKVKGQYLFGPVSEILPKDFYDDFVESIDHYGQVIKGFDSEDALLCGIESRTSSPIKILRNEMMESCVHGLFVCGEGAGYAGGITSAAVDGVKVAEKIALMYN